MTDPTNTEKKRKPSRPLNSAQKAEAIALWKSGSVTLTELETRFKKDRTTFLRLFKAEGVEKGESAVETTKKVTEAVERSIVESATVLANRIRETKEEHYRMASGIAKLTWSLIVTAKQANRPIGSIASDMKSLQMAAQVLKITREERYAVLGINADDDNDDKPLPDLVVQELTVQDIKRMHAEQAQATADEMGLNEITDLGDSDLIDDVDDRVEVDD